MPQAALTALIERVYDAVLEDDGWTGLVGELVKAFHGTQAALLSQDDRSGMARVQAHTVAVPEKTLRDYETYYAPRSPLFHYFKSVPLGRPYTDADYPDQALYRRSEIYNDLYRPLNAEHLLGVDLERRTGLSTYLIIRRGGDAGFFSAAETRRLAGLNRHLARALRLGRLVEGAGRTAGALEGLLAAQPAAVLLTDAVGRVAYLNPRAERLIRRGDGLRLTQGRLRCERPADGDALDHLIAAASGAPPADHSGVLPVHRRSCAEPLMVEVLALPAGLGATAGPRLAMLRIADREARAPRPETIAAMFGLTPAEAAVTAALCRGESLAGHAARSGTSLHTVRTLLRNAMAKTDTHRQAELVSRVLSLL
jgi:DNA-binding CsgD family transcriptional regulator